jgi:hypothetical protein
MLVQIQLASCVGLSWFLVPAKQTRRSRLAVHDFLEKKRALQKEYAEGLQALVQSTRKQANELLEKKKYSREDNQLFDLWENLLMCVAPHKMLF